MRQAILIVITTAAGLGACAPVPAGPYGYAPGPSYGYTDGAYAPGPYYAEPAYAPYATPGPAIIIGGERRWDGRDRDRERYERQREGGYRGNLNPPGRDFGRSQPPPNFGGGRPGPENRPPPMAAARPAPPPPQAAPAPPAGGAAFEQWNRTHVNSSPMLNESGPR